MAKVYLDAGHGGSDPGAVANGITEKVINLTVTCACAEELKRHGVQVNSSGLVDKGDSISNMAAEANKWGADLVVSIHFNAGGGDGFEAYYHYGGGKGKNLAQNIEAEIKKIGQNSRGCKIKKDSSGNDYYGMIRLTNAPCVILEGGFLDNKEDVKLFDTVAEQKKFGVAYAKGILKTLGITYKEAVKETTKTDGKLYRVQVGAYSKKENAEAMLKKLKAAGFDGYIA